MYINLFSKKNLAINLLVIDTRFNKKGNKYQLENG